MTDKKVLLVMKIIMSIGFVLIFVGHYLLSYTELTTKMGPTGYAIGGSVIAIGLIMSLPTKMYLTFVFVMREKADSQATAQKAGEGSGK